MFCKSTIDTRLLLPAAILVNKQSSIAKSFVTPLVSVMQMMAFNSLLKLNQLQFCIGGVLGNEHAMKLPLFEDGETVTSIRHSSGFRQIDNFRRYFLSTEALLFLIAMKP